ncbi:MAG: VanW family protein [Bacillota bacterium]|nr:VanW family protein [Bacillota bacterium]
MEQERNRPREQQKEMQREAQKKNGKKVLIAVLLLICAAAGVFGYMEMEKRKALELLELDGIYPGITIDGADVSGCSKAEALTLLNAKYHTELEDTALTLTYEQEGAESKAWDISFGDIGAGFDVAQAVDEAYGLGREGTEKENLAAAKKLLKGTIDVAVPYVYKEELLAAKLQEVAEAFDCEAVDSRITTESGKATVIPEENGLKMDLEGTLEAAAAVAETAEGGAVGIVAEVTVPAVTAKDFEGITDLIGTYYTTFNNSDKNRNTNLAVGCNYINGTILKPGEVFSANEGLGSQTSAGGYKMAGVYNNGKVEQGMAGGVCQVTTTLYNAAILAELEIVERHAHSMTVGYVPLGRDAAVAGTYKDLKFKNNTEYPVLIEAYARDGKLVMNIFGHEIHGADRKVSFDTVYEATIPKPEEKITEDPERPEGEREVTHKGRTGSKVSVYKTVTENGTSNREWFSASSYRAVADEVTVGTKPVAEVPAVVVPQQPGWVEGFTGEGSQPDAGAVGEADQTEGTEMENVTGEDSFGIQ